VYAGNIGEKDRGSPKEGTVRQAVEGCYMPRENCSFAVKIDLGEKKCPFRPGRGFEAETGGLI